MDERLLSSPLCCTPEAATTKPNMEEHLLSSLLCCTPEAATTKPNMEEHLLSSLLCCTPEAATTKPNMEEHLLSSLLSDRRTELQRVRYLRRVSSSSDEECPICQERFAEQSFPRPRMPAGAFECTHSVCYDCNLKLLTIAATTIDGASYRCPLCRADAVAEEHSPLWLSEQRSSPVVVAAREEAERRRADEAPLALRRAALTAARQVSALLRLMEGDESMDRLRRAVQEASEVLVDVGIDELPEDELTPLTPPADPGSRRQPFEGAAPDDPAEIRAWIDSVSGDEPLEAARAPAAAWGSLPAEEFDALLSDPTSDGELSVLRVSPIASPITSPSSSVVAATFNREAEREAMEEASEGLTGTSGARLEAFMAAVASAFQAVEGELDARVGRAPAWAPAERLAVVADDGAHMPADPGDRARGPTVETGRDTDGIGSMGVGEESERAAEVELEELQLALLS